MSDLPAISLGALVREHRYKFFLVPTLAEAAKAHENYTMEFAVERLRKRRGPKQKERVGAEAEKGLFGGGV